MNYYYEGEKHILSIIDLNDEINMDKGNPDTNIDKTTIIDFLDDNTGNIHVINGEKNE